MTLRRIIRAVDIHSRYLVSHYGLTGPQLSLLTELNRLGPVSVSVLTRGVHLSQATVTGIIDRLERRGLVSRAKSETDKRRVVVNLTAAGTQLLSHAPPALQESFIKRFEALADWEQSLMLSSLQRLVAMMEMQELDAKPLLTSGSMDASPEHFAPPAGPEEIDAWSESSEYLASPAGWSRADSEAPPDESPTSFGEESDDSTRLN